MKMTPPSIQKFNLEDMGKLVVIVAASKMTQEYLIKQKILLIKLKSEIKCELISCKIKSESVQEVIECAKRFEVHSQSEALSKWKPASLITAAT